MKLAEKVLEKEKKLHPSKVQSFKDALKYATEMLGKSKLKLQHLKKNKADNLKVLDAKDTVEFWMQRVQDITRKLKLGPASEFLND
jgi:hypothetical protein